MSAIEITVRIKDEDKTYNQKFLHYDQDLSLSHADPSLKGYVDEAIANFKGTPDEVAVKILYFW